VALHWQIILGLAVGAACGLVVNGFSLADSRPVILLRNIAEPIGQVFLRLIFMVVIPLVFSALTLAVAGIGDLRRLGRMGLRTLVMAVILSGISVAIGITIANVARPGAHLPEEKRLELFEKYATPDASAMAVAESKKAKPLRVALLDIIPKNPLQEMVGALDGSSPGGGMLSVIFFALMFGIAMALVPQRTGPLLAVLEGVYDVSMVIIRFAMRLAPLGVGALVFSLTASLGLGILKSLAWFVSAVIAGLLLQLVGVYSIIVGAVARMHPLRFFKGITDAMVTAFATSSSNATLPTTLRVAEKDLGLRPEISRFVLTVGATGNQNGTALFEGVTVLFLAQVFGVDLTLGQQVTVVLMAVLAGIGTAGVPGGSIPLIVMVLVSVGIPAEGIGIILGVDRLLDMSRTVLNVTGDIAIAACVDRTEGRPAASPATA
jgi:DAACS family dicarboxylate/amino acid:cation (Na+ or H+) symporter